MAKPYFRINSATYSSSSLTLNYSFWRNRGSIAGGSDLTITGISSTSSITFNQPASANLGNEIKTIPVVNLQGGSGASYVDPSAIVWTFSGTPSTSTSAKVVFGDPVLGTVSLSTVTASNSTLSTFLSSVVSSVSSNSSGVVATSSDTTLTFTVPATGNKFNSKALTFNLTKGSGGSTIAATSNQGLTFSGTFSAGITTFSIGLVSQAGGFSANYFVSSSTFSQIP